MKHSLKNTFPIRLQQHQGLVVVQKPTGMNTHRPDPDKPGLVEFLQTQMQEKLYVVHRLDKETSGVLLLAKSADLAQKLGDLFESQQVKKEYLFLTDKKVREGQMQIESEISKQDENFISRESKRPNSKTQFIKLREGGQYILWKALPETGKPHQIRLHAQALGIPILGDRLHGGSPFFRLCLHAAQISLELENENLTFKSEAAFDENCEDKPSFQFREAMWKRTQFLDLSQAQTARWVHDECEAFRLDQFGSHLWMGWYAKEDPNLGGNLFSEIKKALPYPLWVRQMKSRGAAQGTQAFLLSQGDPQSIWIAEENGTKFEMRSDQGLSPGLFLDQRENRAWVRSMASQKTVLNLFAYTGAFSVNAALGSAKQVCTVDVSRAFLDWSKKNFSLNALNPNNPEYEFWTQDCLLFLKGCQKRQRQFDLIICDPPTLGRSKDGTFDLKRDLKDLLQSCWSALSPHGQLLFSCNYEGWDLKTLRGLIEQALGSKTVKIQPAPGSPLDYESSGHESLMKSLILTKNSLKD